MSFFNKFFQKAAPADEPAAVQAPVIDENEVTPEKLERKHLFEQLRKAIQQIVGYAADGSVITNDIDNEVGLTEALGAILGHKMKGFRANRLLSISVLLEMGLEALPPTIKIPPFGKELRDSSLLVRNKAWIVYCLNNHVMYATIDAIIKDFAFDSYEEAGILSYPETSVMILGLIAPLDEFEFELSVEVTPTKEISLPSTPVTHYAEHSATPIQPMVSSPKPKGKSLNSHSMSSLPTEDDGIVVAKTKKVRKKVRPAQHVPQAESELEKKDEIIAGLEKQVEDLKKENSVQKSTITLQQKEIVLLKKKIALLEKSLASAKASIAKQQAEETRVESASVAIIKEEEEVNAGVEVETKTEEKEQESISEAVVEENAHEENNNDTEREVGEVPIADQVKEEQENIEADVEQKQEEDPIITTEPETSLQQTSTTTTSSTLSSIAEEEEKEESTVVSEVEEKKNETPVTPESYNPFEDYNNSDVSKNIDSGVANDEPVPIPVKKEEEVPVPVAPAEKPDTTTTTLPTLSNSSEYDDFVILPRENGTFKNGTQVDKKFERVVTKISIRAAKSVQYISFEFSDGKVASQGVSTGDESSITLKPGQYVSAIYGRKNQQSLDRLLIKFNTGEPFGPFGSQDGPDTFAFYAEEDEYLYDINITKAKKLFSQEPATVVPVWKSFK